ncbi:hypothetical protein GGF37_001440 [Kickxella alabastrina]|nr:hypothetical protein GGF37_001440 [Kickxella alabastrina]
MAPILLKIKGTKLFSPFNEIEDVGDLSTLWRVCTKVKDSLENGSRLENLSWRLWHLHQTLEARGKGKDYRKLSPATTQQLEKTIRRPEAMRKAKPMQIKVRLGKSTADRVDASADSGQAQCGQLQQHDARRRDGGSMQGVSAPVTAHSRNDKDPAGSSASGSEKKGVSAKPSTALVAKAAAEGASTRAAEAVDSMGGIGSPLGFASPDSTNPAAVAEVAAAALASLAPVMHTQQPIHTHTHANAQAHTHACTSTANESGEEVQASDFMSFGPSSFLSSGFDLDAPQIEITLDDIFSVNSGDWSQFGFSTLPAGAPLGMPGAMGEYGAAPAMWGGVGYPGPMGAVGFPTTAHMQVDHAKNHSQNSNNGRRHDGPICDNCGVTSTPLWRRSADDTILCNACGLFYRLHKTHRPKSLRTGAGRKDGADDDAPRTVCSNCATMNTPLWRRDEDNNPLCNACGLFHRLHQKHRPIALKTDVIRKRQRYDTASTSAPRKRSSASKQRVTMATATDTASDGGASVAASNATSESPTPTAATGTMGPPKPTKPKRSRSKVQQAQIQILDQSKDQAPESLQPDSTLSPAPLPVVSLQAHSTNTLQKSTPLTPLSAPPVSYSANGTQLLNSADAGIIHCDPALQSHGHHNHSFDQDKGHNPTPEPTGGSGYDHANTYQRRHTMASEFSGMPPAYHSFGSIDGGSHRPSLPPPPPLPLQQSATQPIYHHLHQHHYQQQQQQQLQQQGGSNHFEGGNGQRTLGASINIPMSPQLAARPDTYFARSQQPQQQSSIQLPLPPLALSQQSTSRHSAATAGSAATGVGIAGGSSSGGSRRASSPVPLVNDAPRLFTSDRQLPSLAELASSAHPADSFRFARQQHQSQQQHTQSYSPLNH